MNQTVKITGKRTELKDFLDKRIKISAFVTNSYRDGETMRLLNNAKIEGTNLEIGHVWLKSKNVPGRHGKRTIEVEVYEYEDAITKDKKYGVRSVHQTEDNQKTIIPNWKLKQIEEEKLLIAQRNEKRIQDKEKMIKSKIKHPYGKIRKVH